MKIKLKNFQRTSNIVIFILTIIFIFLAINTGISIYKLNKLKSKPHNSINVSPEVNEPSIPTFNKPINYIGVEDYFI